MDVKSLPVRERGLKSLKLPLFPPLTCVAPRAGAWIEMSRNKRNLGSI